MKSSLQTYNDEFDRWMEKVTELTGFNFITMDELRIDVFGSFDSGMTPEEFRSEYFQTNDDYPNLICPTDFDFSLLSDVFQCLLVKADEKAKLKGGPKELCGNASNWRECLAGFIDGEKMNLILYFNVGTATYAVKSEVAL